MIKIADEVKDKVGPIPAKHEEVKKPNTEEVPATAAQSAATNLTKEDILNVENKTLLRSIAYCEYRIDEIDKEMKQAIAETRRLDPTLMSVMKEAKSVSAMMMSGFQSNNITPQEYLEILNEIIAKDQSLAKYFSPNKANPKINEKL